MAFCLRGTFTMSHFPIEVSVKTKWHNFAQLARGIIRKSPNSVIGSPRKRFPIFPRRTNWFEKEFWYRRTFRVSNIKQQIQRARRWNIVESKDDIFRQMGILQRVMVPTSNRGIPTNYSQELYLVRERIVLLNFALRGPRAAHAFALLKP